MGGCHGSSMNQERPKVGLGVYILNAKSEILFLRRKGAHGAHTWCPPGGHLEYGESFEGCAQREAKEESGLNIQDIEFIGVINDIMPEESKHYVTIHMSARPLNDVEPQITEPEKCDAIGWFSLNK